jgi:hypothetical protein
MMKKSKRGCIPREIGDLKGLFCKGFKAFALNSNNWPREDFFITLLNVILSKVEDVLLKDKYLFR